MQNPDDQIWKGRGWESEMEFAAFESVIIFTT